MGLVNRVMRALTKKAESEVSRLEQAVVRWLGEAERKRQELEELQASAGDRLLADTTGALARELAVDAQELRFSIDGAQAAAGAAERQLQAALDELALAQAAEKRDQVAKLTAEADAHQAKVDELLRQLEQLDGPRYVPYAPSIEEQRAMLAANGRCEWTASKADLLRNPIATVLAEAEALEAPVLEKRRAREAASRPLVPSAGVDVPAWDDIHGDSRVYCSVDEGGGTATFEVHVSGQQGGTWTVTLPDEQGRRAWSRRVRIEPGGGGASVRCNGEVLAQETRPGRLVSNGLGTFWVERA